MRVALAVALGSVFVVAGASKLVSGATWRLQAAGLGARRPVASALPWIEIALGALAVAQIGRRWVASALCALLVVFTVAIVRRLRRGERPPCACFGAWSSAPLGPAQVARNIVLIGLSIAVAVVS